MNPSTPMYGMIKINDSELDLGCCKPQDMMVRASQVMATHKGEAVSINLRIEKTPIVSLNIFGTPEDANLAEFESALKSAPPAAEVELFPGVTVQAAYEAEQSPEGQAYKRICNPDKRVGLNQAVIDEIRNAYFSRFPEIASLYPLWQD